MDDGTDRFFSCFVGNFLISYILGYESEQAGKETMKIKHLVGGILIAICIGVGVFSLRSSMTPYVGFAEAKESDRVVQVAGSLIEDTTELDKESGEYHFTLEDNEGVRMKVSTAEKLPANFLQSTTVVAIGSYTGERFHADHVLVKCPSKYEREEIDDEHPGELPE